MNDKNNWEPKIITQGGGGHNSFIPSNHYTAEQYAAKARDDQMNAKLDAIIALLTEIRDRLTKASQ